MKRERLSTKTKALHLNLNRNIYGTIAEIGGGQEVARAFFQAGGASGTIAKTISAYDKTFSDYLYNDNKSGRYVSEGRLVKMLKKEYDEVIHLLDKNNDKKTFFAFANTVATINFEKTIEGHGWLGVRFQLSPKGKANEVVVHVNLHEKDNLLQQYTLGTFGVNLIYACYHYHTTPNIFLQSLMDNLDRDRIEVNMCGMKGPDLSYVDNRLLSVQLVKNGMTNATMFDSNGEVHQPGDLLHNKNVLAFRGSFRPITYVGFDMLKTSFALFKKDHEYKKQETVAFCEMTMNNLLEDGDFDETDFLDRVDILNGMGQNVMVSNFEEFYKLNQYFNEFKIKELRLVIGSNTFEKVISKEYYKNLKGGTLEAFGYLFSNNTKLYVYPSQLDPKKPVLTSKNLKVPKEIEFIYKHLVKNCKIIDIEDANLNRLHINSTKVRNLILAKDPTWEDMVPVYISEIIKQKKLFHYEG